MYIYKITNKKNGRTYVGITKKHFTRRWRAHSKHCHNRELEKAFLEYSNKAFMWEVLEEGLDEKRARFLEKQYIHAEIAKGIDVYNVDHKASYVPKIAKQRGEMKPTNKESRDWLKEVCRMVDLKEIFVDQSWEQYFEKHMWDIELAKTNKPKEIDRYGSIFMWVWDYKSFIKKRYEILEWLYDNPRYINW
tara:strand:- start:50 stop:622 length:573 start_codon:yes stop_codon:yes gene_type:complete